MTTLSTNGFRLIPLVVALALAAVDVSANKNYTIAYVPGKRNAFYQLVEKGIRQKAREVNARVVVEGYPENWDAVEQIRIIEETLAKGQPRFLIISPAMGRDLRNVLMEIHNEGVAVITVDRALENHDDASRPYHRFPLLHVATDQWEGGRAMAIRLAQLIGGRGTVYINSTFPDIPTISRRFKAFLQTTATFPNISVVGIDVAGIDFSNSDKGVIGSGSELERNAHKQSLEIMQKHPDINAIFCTNHLSGKGIIKTMLATGLEGSVKVGVWDATPEMMQAIDSGVIDLVLAQKPEEMGVAAVFWGNRYLEAEETIPTRVKIDFHVITKSDAMDDKIRQLFYR